MNRLTLLLAMIFFVSECNADIRILEQITKSRTHEKNSISKQLKPKEKIKAKTKVKTKTKKPALKKKQKINIEDLTLKNVSPKEIITSEELDIKNNIAFLPNQTEPFTGKHLQLHSNGKKYIETNYKDGKKEGEIIMWDENEHKIGVLRYKDGERMD